MEKYLEAKFFRYDSGFYHPFSILHYLSIISFHKYNPEFRVVIYTNKPITTGWFYLLKDEIPDLEIRSIPEADTTKFDHVAHFIDWYRLKDLYENGGLMLDMDYICLMPIKSLLDFNKLNLCDEYYLDDNIWNLCISIMYSKPGNEFIKAWMENYNKYEKGKEYTSYSNNFATELYKLRSDDINIIPKDLTDPFSACRLELNELFLHNLNIKRPIMFHTSESAAWDRYLKFLDVKHIMTVDTTFTKLVREFVSHLWDPINNKPLIRY